MNPRPLEMELLGHPSVRLGETGAPPSAVPVLAYLVIGRQRWHPRTTVAANLCPDVDEHHARRRLNTILWRLRRWLAPNGVCPGSVVVCRGGAIRFDPDLPLHLDVERFESTISAAVNQPDPLPADAASDLQDGVRLYRGELMEGCYDEWVLAERARLSELYLAALYRLVAFHRARGETAEVARFGEQALRCEPLREDVHRELMAAYAEAGQPQRALDQFERCRRLLATDLGVDPMPETLALVARIRRGPAAYGPTFPSVVDLRQLTHELLDAQRQLGDLADLIARSLATLKSLQRPARADSFVEP